MRHLTRLLALVTLLVFLSQAADAAKKPVMKKVYMFGFAASFSDSLAFQTDVQAVDSVWLTSNGFLVDRSLYSLQLQYYVESQGGNPYSTCTVFFSEKPRKVHKVWEKVRKRYQKTEGIKLRQVAATDFQFRPEQYIDYTTNESDTIQGGTAPVSGAKP